MDFKVDKEGFLLDSEGNRLKIEGEEVRAEGFMGQDQIDNKIQERLARQKKEFEGQIKSLEAQANRTPELQDLLDQTKKKLGDVEQQLQEAEANAQKQVSSQMSELKKRAETAEQKLQETEQNWLREQVSNQLISHVIDPETGKQLFVNPNEDVVPRLLNVHKREPVRDDNGQPIEGKVLDLFEVEVYDKETGQSKKQVLPPDKAIKAFAANPKNRHYLSGNSSGGPGQGEYRPGATKLPGEGEKKYGVSKIAAGLKRGDMKNMPATPE